MVTDTSPKTKAQPHYDPHVLGGGSTVPYVALWSGEHDLPTSVIEHTPTGITYPDENVADRDHHGVLWTRFTTSPGHGRPLYRQMHPLRQRRAMRRLLCQVCAQPADHTDQGHLWILLASWQESDAWPDDIVNQYPPLCLNCARLSKHLCPPLRRGYVAVRAHSTLYGVIGIQYQAARPYPAVRIADNDDGQPVAYDNPAVQWTQAIHLTRALHKCTVADINHESDSYPNWSGS